MKSTCKGLILCPIAGKGGCGKTSILPYLIAQILASIKPTVCDLEQGAVSGWSRYCPHPCKLKLNKRRDVQQSDCDRPTPGSSVNKSKNQMKPYEQ